MPPSQRFKRCVACQHFLDAQTLRLQAGAGEDDVIDLPSSLELANAKKKKKQTVTLGTTVYDSVTGSIQVLAANNREEKVLSSTQFKHVIKPFSSYYPY